MDQKIIAVAVPGFFVLIALELFFARSSGRPLYRLHDAITDLGCGVGSQVVNLFIAAAYVGGYAYLHEHFALTSWSMDNLWAWLAAVILFDHQYYWWHRLSHQVNVMWAAHVVHHQSEDYNLAVALRQAWFTTLTGVPFYFWMALLGVPPVMFVTVGSINLIYQFWIHTEAIRTLGPLEWVLNTPSHHRVHHGVNPEYLDRNHGGMFIVFDRLFGTFAPETAPVVYGTVDRHTSWNPIWANFAYWAKLADLSHRAQRFSDKVWVWFAHPSWRPASLGGPVRAPEVHRPDIQKWETPRTPAQNQYILTQFAIVLLCSGAYLALQVGMDFEVRAIAGAWILLGTVSIGALAEGRSWGFWAELLRHAAFVGLGLAGVIRYDLPPWAGAPVIVLSLGGAVALKAIWSTTQSRQGR